MAIGVTILERLESGNGHLLPEIRSSDRFPYCEKSGNVIYKSTMPFLSLTMPCNAQEKHVFSVKMNMQPTI